jgi:dTDP-glucose 4,6-dehydratase
VEDNCQGIELVLRAEIPGEVYNIGGGTDLTNNELTDILLRVCGASWDSVRYIADRPAKDIRYSMDWSKIAAGLGYKPARALEDGLAETAEWYRKNPGR